MIDPDIKNRLDLLSPEYAEFVKSDFSTEVAANFGPVTRMSEDSIDVLNNGIILFLLFILDNDQLATFLATECQITNGEAETLTAAIIASMPEGYAEAHNEVFKQFNPETATPPEPTQNEEPTYSNTQEAILNERPPSQ